MIDGFDVEHKFPHLGVRTMRVNACQVFYDGGADTTILLGIEDVTDRRKLEDEKEDLLRQKDALLQQQEVLLQELEHRVANSLQIIASIILMKAPDSDVGRHASSSPRRSPARFVDCHCTATTPCIRGRWTYRNWALSLKVVRDPCHFHDW